MFSLVSFTGIWRYRQQSRRDRAGLEEAGSACKGEHAEEYFPQDRLPDDYDPATANDLSYEDALLDSKVRHFLREEYSRIEPPQGVFQRLVKLLNVEQVQKREQSATWSMRLFSGAYRAANGHALSRLVPSGIAVAILVVVGLGSSTSGLLRTGQFSSGVESTPVAGQSADMLYTSAPVQEPPVAAGTDVLPAVDVTGGEEAYIVLRGTISVNLPLQNKIIRETINPKYNRVRLDPF